MKFQDVSVVVITRNEERNIEGCLRSIAGLDYPKYEVLVVDSSTDRTPQIVRKFKGARLVAFGRPGFAAARNVGVNNSRNAVIAFTDADCIVPKDWLKKLVSRLGGKVVVAGGAALPPPDSSYMGRCIACLGFPAGGSLGTEIMDSISTCNAVFDRRALEDVGGFDESLKYGTEDSDVSRRIRKRGYVIELVQDSFVFHKTRSLREFVLWSHRRGMAMSHKSRNPVVLLGPLAVVAFPFTRKFRLLVRKRKEIGIGLPSILITVPFLFLIRRLLIGIGWLHGIGQRLKGKEKHKEVQRRLR